MTSSTILPLSAAPQTAVRDYLRGRGLPDGLIDWKYFDSSFNRGRERGYVWMRDGSAAGFVGVVPTAVGRGSATWEMAWTCDWSLADPESSPGMGVKLLKRAIAEHPHLASLGGNGNTQKLVPRLATRTVPSAGLVYWRPLRLGAVLQKLALHRPAFRFLNSKRLGRLPISRKPTRRTAGVHREAGVSTVLRPLLEREQTSDWSPRYQFDDIDWLVGRCPDLVSETWFIGDAAAAEAAALLWRTSESTDFWRLTLWGGTTDGQLSELLSAAVRRVYDAGGLAVSTVISHRDPRLREMLKKLGFYKGPRSLPLFLFTTRQESQPIDDFSQLSYLCTDLAYRF